MDGMDDNDQLNGYAFTGVLRETLDSVDEFRVTTGLANSDQGRSAGAQVNLVTKSGTNLISWHQKETTAIPKPRPTTGSISNLS